ncbi:MAG: DUF3990 domain-containing protein [Bacilli bacterium]
MILYHTSDREIKKPDISYSRNYLDFGRGFYMTSIKQQAVSWGAKFKRSRKSAVLNTYTLNLDMIEQNYNVLKFDGYSQEWFEYVIRCRNGEEIYKQFDVVIGGVADDDIFTTVNLYFAGVIDQDNALRNLKYHKPNHQLCILNQAIIERELNFESSEVLV